MNLEKLNNFHLVAVSGPLDEETYQAMHEIFDIYNFSTYFYDGGPFTGTYNAEGLKLLESWRLYKARYNTAQLQPSDNVIVQEVIAESGIPYIEMDPGTPTPDEYAATQAADAEIIDIETPDDGRTAAATAAGQPQNNRMALVIATAIVAILIMWR